MSNFSFVSPPLDSRRITLKGSCPPALCLITAVTVGSHWLGASAPEKVSEPGSSSRRSCVWMAVSHAGIAGSTFGTLPYTYHFLFLECSFPLFTCWMSACHFFKASLRPSFCPLVPDHSGGGRSPGVCPPVLSGFCHSPAVF